jgi:hypothetical protein
MRHTIIRQRSKAHLIVETLGALAGVVLLLALGDVVIVLSLALAAAVLMTAWWIRRNPGRRARSRDVALASVSHLPASHWEPTKARTHTPWRRRNAA